MYLFVTNLKGVNSMKLRRELDRTQKTAWHLAHRLREAWERNSGGVAFQGPVEVDETYIRGKERNKHADKKIHAGRGAVGKAAVVGMKDRETGTVSAKVVESTDAATLQGFVLEHIEPGAAIYTDEHGAYWAEVCRDASMLPELAAERTKIESCLREAGLAELIRPEWAG